jgi:hypothetical protein
MTPEPASDVGRLTARDKDLDAALERIPCASSAEARRFILFGGRCLESTPVNGVTPCSLLTAWPGLLGCVSMIVDWAEPNHEPAVRAETLLEALELAHQIARKAAGEFQPSVSGPDAACWAVYHLATAALIAAGRAKNEGVYADSRRAIIVAVRLCRQAAVAITAEALQHQEALLRESFPTLS